jgi:hypothetical protein
MYVHAHMNSGVTPELHTEYMFCELLDANQSSCCASSVRAIIPRRRGQQQLAHRSNARRRLYVHSSRKQKFKSS